MKTYTSKSKLISDSKHTNIYYQRFFSNTCDKILDVGCSVRNFVVLDPENIIGVDLDDDAIRICKKRGLNCIQMNIRSKINFQNNYFSAVNASQIIEHLEDPLKVMKEFFRILKPGGLLILAAPDAKKIKDKFWDDYTHIRPYNKKSLEQLAKDAGFVNIKTIYEPKSITGIGKIVRKRIISAKTVIFLQNLLLSMGIRHNSIYLTALKPIRR